MTKATLSLQNYRAIGPDNTLLTYYGKILTSLSLSLHSRLLVGQVVLLNNGRMPILSLCARDGVIGQFEATVDTHLSPPCCRQVCGESYAQSPAGAYCRPCEVWMSVWASSWLKYYRRKIYITFVAHQLQEKCLVQLKNLCAAIIDRKLLAL